MLLVIDVGNTNTVIGVYDNEELVASWRAATRQEATADEYEILLRGFFRKPGIDPGSISGVIVSCVVPPLVATFSELSESLLGCKALIVEPGIKTGMPILYDNPKEVGADRIVNAVAAFNKHKGPLVVVDFGTATTFDAVSENGEYMGGAIAPGIGISMDALFVHAAKLPRVEFVQPKTVIGKNTTHSIQSGIFFGYVGLVDAVVTRLKNELGPKAKAVATGGFAELIARESCCIDEVDGALTLTGLRLIYAMNS